MPRCEGLPGGPCPKNANNRGVKLSQGDLMLCSSCEATRFPEMTKSATMAERGAEQPSATATGAGGASATQSLIKTSASYVVNELLSYVHFYRDRSSMEALHKAVTGFYHPTEITEAKRRLTSEFSTQLVDCPHIVARRQTSTRSLNDVETEDIIRIFEFLDDRSMLANFLFAAVTLDRLPKYAPEEVNICSVAEKQARIDSNVAVLTERLNEMSAAALSEPTAAATSAANETLVKIVQQLSSFGTKFQDQLDTMTNACTKLTESYPLSAQSSHQVGNVPASPSASVDRSTNVVITGVTESRNPAEWRDVVSRALTAAAGDVIQIKDAFRLGRFADGRKRPILVKLNTVWDRRLVLNGARKVERHCGILTCVYFC